jgi:hypothetical protein
MDIHGPNICKSNSGETHNPSHILFCTSQFVCTYWKEQLVILTCWSSRLWLAMFKPLFIYPACCNINYIFKFFKFRWLHTPIGARSFLQYHSLLWYSTKSTFLDFLYFDIHKIMQLLLKFQRNNSGTNKSYSRLSANSSEYNYWNISVRVSVSYLC